MKKTRHVVILADGEPPRAEIPLRVLTTAGFVVACDGAARTARALGRAADAVVGDGDSLDAAERAELGAAFIHVAEQDRNDLHKAFRFVCARFADELSTLKLAILGATGRREDHTLGNIFQLPEFAESIPDTTLYTDTGSFTVVRAARTFPCRPGESVSVFAPEPGTRVESAGLVWPLGGVPLLPLWRGTLNKTCAAAFTLTPSRPILLYRPSLPARNVLYSAP